jgi:hypothetical protein
VLICILFWQGCPLTAFAFCPCRFGGVFPNVQNAVKKREQSLQEYNRTQAKYNKYQDRDRTGQNVVRLDTVSIF